MRKSKIGIGPGTERSGAEVPVRRVMPGEGEQETRCWTIQSQTERRDRGQTKKSWLFFVGTDTSLYGLMRNRKSIEGEGARITLEVVERARTYSREHMLCLIFSLAPRKPWVLLFFALVSLACCGPDFSFSLPSRPMELARHGACLVGSVSSRL